VSISSKYYWFFVVVIVFLSFNVPCLSKSTNDSALTLKQVPVHVRATIERYARGGNLKKIEKIQRDSETHYKADILTPSGDLEIKVDEKGALVGRRLEKSLSRAEVPKGVWIVSSNIARDGAIKKIKLVHEDGKAYYEAKIIHRDKEQKVRIAEDGSIILQELESVKKDTKARTNRETLEWIPVEAKNVLLSYCKEGKVRKIDKDTGAGVTVYTMEYESNGKMKEVEILEDGTLVEYEEEVFADEVPEWLHEKVRSKFGIMSGVTLEKKTLYTYEVTRLVDGVKEKVLITPDGECYQKIE